MTTMPTQAIVSVTHGLHGSNYENINIDFHFSVPIGVLNYIATLLRKMFNNVYTACVLIPNELFENIEYQTLILVYYYGLPVWVSASYCGLYEDMSLLFVGYKKGKYKNQ